MNPRILAAIATVLSMVTKAHLTVTAIGLTVSLSIPWLLVAAMVVMAGVLALLIVRAARGFRSSPYLRPAYAAGAM